LSSSGGSGGSKVELDVSNFLLSRLSREDGAGHPARLGQEPGHDGGVAVIAFTIRRDGTVESPAVRRPSGFFALDNAALRAVARANRLPPLPSEFPRIHPRGSA
jgi:TonB family protein